MVTVMEPPQIRTSHNPWSRVRASGKDDIDLGVIHAMRARYNVDGKIVDANDFLRTHARLSAHDLIEPDGEIVRCVPWDRMAWHAKGFNTRSIGFELLVYNDRQPLTIEAFYELIGVHPRTKQPIADAPSPFTDRQYESLGWLMARARLQYPLMDWNTHHGVDPTRKWDPGPTFDFARAKHCMLAWQKILEKTT